MNTATTIFMALFWAYVLGVFAFAIWSGRKVGKAQGELLVAIFAEQARNCGAKKDGADKEKPRNNPGFNDGGRGRN